MTSIDSYTSSTVVDCIESSRFRAYTSLTEPTHAASGGCIITVMLAGGQTREIQSSPVEYNPNNRMQSLLKALHQNVGEGRLEACAVSTEK